MRRIGRMRNGTVAARSAGPTPQNAEAHRSPRQLLHRHLAINYIAYRDFEDSGDCVSHVTQLSPTGPEDACPAAQRHGITNGS